MADKLRSLKTLDTSLHHFSNKSTKSPLASSYMSQQHFFAKQLNHEANLIKRYQHLYNKSSYHISREKDQRATKCRNNDYVKKIMFDNQEQLKRIKQIEKINSTLQVENKKLVLHYCEMFENYTVLKEKYHGLINQYGIENQDRFSLKKLVVLGEEEEDKYRFHEVESDLEIDVFTRLFKGISAESQILGRKDSVDRDRGEKEGKIRVKDQEFENLSSLCIRKALSRDGQPEMVERMRRNTIFSFRKSEAVTTLNQQTQTEEIQPGVEEENSKEIGTQQKIELSRNQEQEVRLSPSSRETELLMKIGVYEQTMRELEEKNEEILRKYERIRAIISGEIKMSGA